MQELASINKELTTMKKQVKSRFGLEDDDVFSGAHDVEVSRIARLPSYVYVLSMFGCRIRNVVICMNKILCSC